MMALRGDNYEILNPIASGGMATVHLGRVVGAGGFERIVAIKVMHPHLASEPECVAMFLDEARLAARIRHPNVVSTLDFRQDDQGVFLVMEYVEGPSLHQITRYIGKQKKTLPLDIAVSVLVATLSGLHAAHELCDATGTPLNLVHRDVSPQNILLGTDGIVRITDFGVARAESRISQSTQNGQLKGKLSYMSPEQASHEPVDRRTDVYAAGIVLWEALTGKRLHREATELLTLFKVQKADHQSPREVNPNAPAAIADVCMRALRRAPEDRYPTAAAFAEALEEAAPKDGISVASPRAVGAFVTSCGVHVRPTSLPPSTATGLSVGVPNSSTNAAAAETNPPASASAWQTLKTPATANGKKPDAAAARHRGDGAAPGPTSGRAAMVVGIAGIAMLVAAFGLMLKTKGEVRAEGDMRPALAAPSAPVAASSAPTAAPTAQPQASVQAPAAAPSEVAIASSSIGADAGARDAGAALGATTPALNRTKVASPKSTKAQSPGAGPVYRPPEL